MVDDAEKLRKGAEEFLDKSLNTDVALIFAPSQVGIYVYRIKCMVLSALTWKPLHIAD